ncbi:Exosome complex component RRP42, partial [Cladochytrium tenue]
MISKVEREFIAEGVTRNIRSDGRARTDLRRMTFEVGLISQASGSCRVCVEGGTDILVGVKVEVGSVDAVAGTAPAAHGSATAAAASSDGPAADDDGGGIGGGWGSSRRDRGRVECHVECSSSAMRSFDPRVVEDLCSEYSDLMSSVFNGDHGGLDLAALCIVPGSTCWVVYIDALVLGYGGNILDPLFVAAWGALRNTLIPKCTVEEAGGRYEFDVADEETDPLPGVQDVPAVLTLHK